MCPSADGIIVIKQREDIINAIHQADHSTIGAFAPGGRRRREALLPAAARAYLRGGAGKLEDFYEVFDKTGCGAALAASLFHYGTLTVPQVKAYLRRRGVPVR